MATKTWVNVGSGNGLFPDQFLLIIDKVQWHSSDGNFTRDTSANNHWNWLTNVSLYISNLPGANELNRHDIWCVASGSDYVIKVHIIYDGRGDGLRLNSGIQLVLVSRRLIDVHVRLFHCLLAQACLSAVTCASSFWKTVEIPTGQVSPQSIATGAIPTNVIPTNHKKWCHPIGGQVSYPTNSPTASTLELCSSITHDVDYAGI